jgi:Do/DeqQ family serine protease
MKFKSLIPFSLIMLISGCSPSHGQNQGQEDADFKGPDYKGLGFHESLDATNRKVPDNAIGLKTSFSPVVKAAAPAVVNVYARRVTRAQVDPFWQIFGGEAPRDQVQQSLGSGVIVRSDGIVVTNNHVVEGGEQFMVVLNDRREYPAKVLLADARTDLAVLKLDTGTDKLPTLRLDTGHDQEVGDLVLAIGNPFGVGQTVTNGIISALNRTDVGPQEGAFIQTDAPINPGNSGGALVDMNGDLIGINSFILSRSGSSAGVGFAIPSALVKRVVDSAVGGQQLVRPWLGARGDTVNAEIAKSLKMARPEGVLVSDIYKGAAADKAGLKVGDVVLGINAEPINDVKALNYRISVLRPNERLSLNITREGRVITLSAVAAPPPATPAKDERLLKGNFPLNGARIINLSPAAADELGLDPFEAGRGVMVFGLESSRVYAARVGLRPGDIIRDINGRAVTSTAELEASLKLPASRWRVTIVRRGQTITADFS